MIVGDPAVFAIESGITEAFERTSFRALGFFVIHIGGRRYGVYKPDATMLACSIDAVKQRIDNRGNHTVPFGGEPAGSIAAAFRDAVYGEGPYGTYFGIPASEFREMVYARDIMWAPDGDEAFDDSSYVLQFDVEDRVRLIAFTCATGHVHDSGTLRDVWLPAADFYRVLEEWRVAFEAEWKTMPKTVI